MTLRAIPQGLFTWNFHLLDGQDVVGATHYTVFGESGVLTVGERKLEIQRQGPVSGTWRLTDPTGKELAVAKKPSAFTRRVEMEWGDAATLELEGEHALTRRMKVTTTDGKPVGTIVPDHIFTRKATLDFPQEVPLEVRLFCLWLAALMWRRAANNSDGG